MNLNNLSKDKKFALLYGIMLGDGCLSHYKTKEGYEKFIVCITGDFYSDSPFYKHFLVPLLKSLSIRSVLVKKRPKNGTLAINLSDKLLFDKVSSLGFPTGKKGNVLEIPKYFYLNNLIRFVVTGYFSTDGCIVLTKNPNKYYPRIEGHGIAPKLILQINDYLNSTGLNGHFYKCKRTLRDPRWKTSQQQYRFQFNGERNLNLFENIINFINPKHQKRFSEFIKYSNNYNTAIKGIPTQKQKPIRNKINKKYNMAAPRVELGTSCS